MSEPFSSPPLKSSTFIKKTYSRASKRRYGSSSGATAAGTSSSTPRARLDGKAKAKGGAGGISSDEDDEDLFRHSGKKRKMEEEGSSRRKTVSVASQKASSSLAKVDSWEGVPKKIVSKRTSFLSYMPDRLDELRSRSLSPASVLA
jgi:hypothetical protein